MLADLRLTSHLRRWRLRRHRPQAALGADVDIPISRLCRLAQALRVTLTDLVTWTEAPAPPGDQPSAATDGLRAPSRPGPRRRS
jgi:hypothetical protein